MAGQRSRPRNDHPREPGPRSDDLGGLLASTDIAMLFLDSRLRIGGFTPAAADVLPLRAGDVGRPLCAVLSPEDEPDLIDGVQAVLRQQRPISAAVRIAGDRLALRQIRPHGTKGDGIAGVVVSYADLAGSDLEASGQGASDGWQRRLLAKAALGVTPFDWPLAVDELPSCEAGVADDLACRGGAEGWRARIRADDRGRVDGLLRQAVLDRQPFRCAYRSNDGADGDRWIEARGTACHGADGRATRISGFLIDITAQKQAERRQELLMAELDHRMKGAMAAIGAIAHQTRTSSDSIAAYVDALEGRIHAMAAAQKVLSQMGWQGARLTALVEECLQASCRCWPGSFDIAGDDVVLRPKAAQSLILALHELAINAAAHGALSAPSGRVALAWTMTGTNGAGSPLLGSPLLGSLHLGSLHLEWRESGGPPVRPPGRTGFGTTAITAFVAADLGATVDLTFPAEGAVCVIDVPSDQLLAMPCSPAAGEGAARVPPRRLQIAD